MQQSYTITWAQIAAACSVFTFLLVLPIAYLKLMIKTALLEAVISARPEMHDLRKTITGLEARVIRLEDRIKFVP